MIRFFLRDGLLMDCSILKKWVVLPTPPEAVSCSLLHFECDFLARQKVRAARLQNEIAPEIFELSMKRGTKRKKGSEKRSETSLND